MQYYILLTGRQYEALQDLGLGCNLVRQPLKADLALISSQGLFVVSCVSLNLSQDLEATDRGWNEISLVWNTVCEIFLVCSLWHVSSVNKMKHRKCWRFLILVIIENNFFNYFMGVASQSNSCSVYYVKLSNPILRMRNFTASLVWLGCQIQYETCA